MDYTAPTPKCPECQTPLLVENFITDKIAECTGCGQVVKYAFTQKPKATHPEPIRDTSHSPAVQRDIQTF